MPKRQRGIEKHGKTWRIRVWIGGREVNRRGLESYEEAVEARKILLDRARLRKHGLKAVEAITFEDYAERYINDAALEKEASTVRRDRQRLKLMEAHFKGLVLDNITEAHIKKFKQARLKSVGHNTVRKDLILLQKVLKEAESDGYLGDVPEIEMPPKRPAKSYRALSRDEAVRLRMAANSNEELWKFVNLMLFTGARPGREAYGFKWSDFDFEKGTVHVRSENAKYRQGRLLKMHPELQKVLEPLKQADGDVLKCKDMRNAWAEAKTVAKLGNDVVPYCLRHTFATDLIEAGATPKQVQKMMGHKTIEITMNTYAESWEAMEREAIDKLPDYNVADVISINRPKPDQS